MAERSVLFNVELNIKDLEKNAKEASERLKELQNKQKELKESSGTNTVEYAKLSNEIRATSKKLKDNASAIEISSRLNKKNTGSLAEMREALKAGVIAYSNLSKEQQDNDKVGGELQRNNLALKKSINELEQGYGTFTGVVGDYEGKMSDSSRATRIVKDEVDDLGATFEEVHGEMKPMTSRIGELEDRMYELALAGQADTEQFKKLQKETVELKKTILEVDKATDALAENTGISGFAGLIGETGERLLALDFKGATQRIEALKLMSSQTTFSGMIGGIKNMGSSLASLGKAILTNPIFLLAGVVTAVGFAIKHYYDVAVEDAIATQKRHTKAIETTIQALKSESEISSKFSDLALKRAELEGKSIEEISKMKIQALKAGNKAELDEIKEQEKLVKQLIKEKGLTTNEEDTKAVQERIDNSKKRQSELIISTALFSAELENIELETQISINARDEKLKEERIAKTKENNAKLIALNNTLKDLILDNEDKTNANQLALIEAKYEALFRLNENNTDALIELEYQKNLDLTALDEQQKEDDLTRLKVKLDRELIENKGNTKIQAELKKAFELDKAKIEKGAQNKKLKRDNELTDKEKQHNLDRIANEQKTADELALINAELNYKNSAGLSNEFEMFQKFQAEKIRIIRENAEREIKLNNLVGAEADKVRAKALLDVKNVEDQKFTATVVKNEKELTAEQLKLQKQTTVALNSANQLSGALFQVTQSRLTKELNLVTENYNAQSEALNKQLEDGLITENEYLTQKANIDTQFRKQSAKIKEEQFKKQKQADLIQSIINTAVGVTQVIANPPLAILAGILGATQTALIASQPTPKFAKGGVFGGNSHANGGTKGVFSDGTQIEVEKDEAFFVLNKKATQKIGMLSNLNQSTGGVPLMAANGVAVSFNSGMASSVVASNVDSQNNMTNQLLSLITNLPTPVVAVQDINNAQNSLMNVVNFASF